VLGISPTPSWVFSFIRGGFPLFWGWKKDGLQIGDGDVNRRYNWSMKKLPRTLGEGLHLLFGFHFFLISSIFKT